MPLVNINACCPFIEFYLLLLQQKDPSDTSQFFDRPVLECHVHKLPGLHVKKLTGLRVQEVTRHHNNNLVAVNLRVLVEPSVNATNEEATADDVADPHQGPVGQHSTQGEAVRQRGGAEEG
ncbi:hypothetical protein CIP107571_01591 [Corynebacterium diphtheriae]|nr:hypothetical protein CIP107571_01591 [Corynebacterium diphtheriae]